jgi:hypothetical protein
MGHLTVSTTTKLRVFAVANEHWAEKLLCEVAWDADTLVATGEKASAVHEVDALIGQLHHAQQGFPVHERAPDGSIRRDARGKVVRTGFRSLATHSPGEVLDALAENLELRKVYRVERS